MPRGGAHRPLDPEDGESSPVEDEEDDECGVEPRSRRRSRKKSFPTGVRPWSADRRPGSEESSEAEDEPGSRRASIPVFYRATDAWWFELVVALAVLVLILVSLFAYTSNWPPVYVVESDSMQHGAADQIGLINTGDLVLAQRLSASNIVTYEAGATKGYSTYGEFGDVLLYHPGGNVTATPIIHRAILYLQYNPNGTYSAPDLAGRPCGTSPGSVYSVSSGIGGCGAYGMFGTLSLYGVGWQNVTVSVTLNSFSLGNHSGFLTMGDNNFRASTVQGQPALGNPDEPSLTTLVQPGWIVGVARGMIPWFGALKLLVAGEAAEVPSQSWDFLALTLIGLLVGAYMLHYALKAEGIEDERRKEQEEEEEAERPVDDSEDRRLHFPWPSRWRKASSEEGDDGVESQNFAAPKESRTSKSRLRTRPLGGRPRPEVVRHGRKRRRQPRTPGGDYDEL